MSDSPPEPPQVDSAAAQKKRSPIAILLIAVTLLLLLAAFAFRVQQSKERNAAAVAAADKEVITAVRTSQAARKDLPRVVQITGSIKARNEVMVLPKSPGRITRILVDVGAKVAAGDVLAVIDSVEMSWRVKQADAQRRQAEAGLEQAKLQRQTAERAQRRVRALHETGGVSQTELEQAESGFYLAEVGVQAAEAAVALAEANLGLSRKAFDDTRITAPFDGVVTKRHINVGAMANPAQPAFSLQDQTALKMDGSVPAHYVGQLKAGMKVNIRIDELPHTLVSGTVSSVAPTLEAETRRAAIEIAVAPAEGLLPYMFGRAEIALGAREGVLVVPSEAVLSVAGKPAVFVIENEHARLVHPDVGATHQGDVVIESGLEPGAVVVVSGSAGLRDGARIVVQGT